jgi:hypothetical protein
MRDGRVIIKWKADGKLRHARPVQTAVCYDHRAIRASSRILVAVHEHRQPRAREQNKIYEAKIADRAAREARSPSSKRTASA